MKYVVGNGNVGGYVLIGKYKLDTPLPRSIHKFRLGLQDITCEIRFMSQRPIKLSLPKGAGIGS